MVGVLYVKNVFILMEWGLKVVSSLVVLYLCILDVFNHLLSYSSHLF